MRRLLSILVLALWVGSPALAHSLRVFATVEGDTVSGYGFFVGGGRPQDVEWSATMAGRAFAQGHTDDEGRFAFAAPATVDGPVRVTINSGEGHVASRILAPARFGAAQPQPADATPAVTPPPVQSPAPTESMIQAAVAKEIAPLLERVEEMDARMRLTDIVSGLCLIFGIAGIALWARGRRA